ncbi:MAG: glycine betaine ABC transporter substrate-binding protein, partial [Eubacteriales bacterium]
MKKIIVVLLTIVMLASVFTACGAKDEKVVNIGHKNYTEQRLMGQLLSVLIEETTDYSTTVTEFGGTMLCFEALKSGDIDVYAEFTGTAYGAILNQTETLGKEETYDFVKKTFEEEYGITWLKDLGFNNTYVLSVTRETAEGLGVTTVSELIPFAGDLIMGCDNEFLGRTDGLPGMKEAYGIEFKKETPMDQGLTYAALRDGQIDVNVSFSTDGRIAKFDLVNLEDDLSFFPPYYVAPILPIEFVEANPEVVETLEKLDSIFS